MNSFLQALFMTDPLRTSLSPLAPQTWYHGGQQLMVGLGLILLLFEITFVLSPPPLPLLISIFLGTSGITKGLCVFIIDRPKGLHPEIVFEGSSSLVPTRHPAGFLGIRQVCIMGGGGIKPKSFDCSILFISLSLSLSLSVVITDIYWTPWKARHSRLL